MQADFCVHIFVPGGLENLAFVAYDRLTVQPIAQLLVGFIIVVNLYLYIQKIVFFIHFFDDVGS